MKRTCTKCGALKSANGFYVSGYHRYGLRAQCISCYLAAKRARWQLKKVSGRIGRTSAPDIGREAPKDWPTLSSNFKKRHDA